MWGGFSDDKTEPYDNYVASFVLLLWALIFLRVFIMANVIHNW